VEATCFCLCFEPMGKADTTFQNLIPLFLRPLRLFLPSERLRSARIVLLKATHLPWVGAIWAYERAVRERRSGATTIGGPQTTTAKRPFRSTINSPPRFASGLQASGGGDGSTSGRTHTASRPRTGAVPSDSGPQLKSLVLALTSQVEQLTSMVSQLQEQKEASMAA
jgi:hypothetical protein